MELKEQVCSLELAKQLKEAGVPQESLFYWSNDLQTLLPDRNWKEDWGVSMYPAKSVKRSDGLEITIEKVSAFTTAELGEMLPVCYQTNRRLSSVWECLQEFTSTTEQVNGQVVTKNFTANFTANSVSFFEPTEADARAKMLLFLIQQKLITF